MDPTPGQLHALKAIICHLLAAHHRDVIAYGAGWTDQQRQQPVGDTGRHEPRHPDAILDAELQHALDDPDPLRGIAQLTARWAAAFVLDPDGITRTKTLGTDRMARKLRDALPGGHTPLRAAVWEFMRPMLSPALAAMHRDAFLTDQAIDTTVRLAEHRGDSGARGPRPRRHLPPDRRFSRADPPAQHTGSGGRTRLTLPFLESAVPSPRVRGHRSEPSNTPSPSTPSWTDQAAIEARLRRGFPPRQSRCDWSLSGSRWRFRSDGRDAPRRSAGRLR